jgi:nucleotide-binding universal stress UspA family protein
LPEPIADYKRKFLVVVDETPECDKAVAFAAYRVRRTGGTVVLMSVIDVGDFKQWLGVEDIMRAEARERAERMLDARIARIGQIAPMVVETVIREGRPLEEIEKLIAEDRAIAILVLAASATTEGPGPLVSGFASRGANALPIPVCIVPGTMSDAEIEAVS